MKINVIHLSSELLLIPFITMILFIIDSKTKVKMWTIFVESKRKKNINVS